MLHYLQVMDDRWEAEVVEYGAVNITGFRIVDASRRNVKDFLDGWRRLDPTVSHGAGKESISVSSISLIFFFFSLVHTLFLITVYYIVLNWYIIYKGRLLFSCEKNNTFQKLCTWPLLLTIEFFLITLCKLFLNQIIKLKTTISLLTTLMVQVRLAVSRKISKKKQLISF